MCSYNMFLSLPGNRRQKFFSLCRDSAEEQSVQDLSVTTSVAPDGPTASTTAPKEMSLMDYLSELETLSQFGVSEAPDKTVYGQALSAHQDDTLKSLEPVVTEVCSTLAFF